MPANADPTVTTRHTGSRRALVGGGALLAALGTISLRLDAAAQATPDVTRASGMLLVQSFANGSFFPTQGDVGAVPYTAILWDAAARGFFLHDAANGTVGIVSTEAVLSALAAAAPPPAALLALPADGSGDAAQIWAIRLVSGEPGSDPGAVTYQGEPLPAEAASAWLETTPPDLPTGPQELGAGYLVIGGLPGVAAGSGQIRLRQASS